MAEKFSKWYHSHRFPYRNDALFSLLLLTVFLVPTVFFQYSYENFESVKFSLLLIFIGAGLMIWLWFDRQPMRYHSTFSLLLVLFLVWALVGTVFSLDRNTSLLGFFPRFTSSFLFFATWAIFIQLLFQRLNQTTYAALIKLLAAVGLITAIFSLLQTVGIGFYEGLDMPALPRVPGFLGNPNFTSMFLVGIVPWALSLLVAARSLAAKIYYGVALFLMLWAIVVLSSRGALLGLGAAFVVLAAVALWKKFKRAHIWYVIICLVVSAGLSFLFLQIARPAAISSTWNLSESNIETRVLVWTVAGRIISAHPWTGSGLGNFQILFEKFRGDEFLTYNGLFDDPHNLFIHLAASGGLPLAAIFLVLILGAVIAGLRSLAAEKNELTGATLAGLAGWLVTASFTPVSIPCFILLGVMLAGLMAARGFKTLRLPKVAAVAGGLVAVALVGYGLAFFSGEYLFYRALGFYYKRDYSRAAQFTRAAIRLNPMRQLFYVYLVGEKIQLHHEPGAVTNLIQQTKAMHSASGTSYRQAAGLYFLLYRQTGNKMFYDQAIANIQISERLEPQLMERYAFESNIRYLVGDYGGALPILQRLVVFNPEDFQSWMILAKIYQSQGKDRLTRFALDRANKIHPEYIQMQILMRLAKQEPDISKVIIPLSLNDSGKLD